MKIKKKYYNHLSQKDKKKQLAMIQKSRRMYKQGKYFTRTKLDYPVKVSPHIVRAQKLYGTKIIPSKELSLKTGCSMNALKQIVKKGEGAYYSSGSRPSQTAHSWAYARLASAISGGKASKVDFHILKTCNKTKKAYKLAIKP
uniref:DUF5824 domain-containing protein n=1 Tax=viral metagenome TaxID=1070528 RepID=A0A6C0D077_9ZZZZ